MGEIGRCTITIQRRVVCDRPCEDEISFLTPCLQGVARVAQRNKKKESRVKSQESRFRIFVLALDSCLLILSLLPQRRFKQFKDPFIFIRPAAGLFKGVVFGRVGCQFPVIFMQLD